MDARAPHWDLAVLVCCNERAADHPRGSCGQAAGVALVAALRDRARAEGVRKRMIVHRTGCLDHCAGPTSVALLGGGPPAIHGVGPEEVEALWDAVCVRIERAVTR